MFIKKIVCTLAAALCVQQAAAVSFNAGTATMEGQWGTGITGQAFSPQENASPNVFDGVSSTDIFPAYLQELNFIRGGNAGGGAAVTSVDIYQPTGATLATSTLIGSSLNTVDTTAEVENEVYTFQFNNLELFHSTTYLAVFKDDGGNVIGLNIEQNFEGNAGVGDYVSGGAIFDFDASGWSGDTNADFSTVFSDMTPTAVVSFNSASTSNGGEWSAGLQGQAFVPRTNATPNPAGIGGQPEEVFLTGMIFTQGGNVGGGDVTTTLDIYRPTGATIATSEFIGSSTNTVDTTAPVDTVFNFEFDELRLFYNATYLAVFKDSGGNVITANITQGFEGDEQFDPFEDNVKETISPGGGIFNYDSFGWAEDTNADFSATFGTRDPALNVPVMGATGIAILFGLITLISIGRKKSQLIR
jgi:hypothetical protein